MNPDKKNLFFALVCLALIFILPPRGLAASSVDTITLWTFEGDVITPAIGSGVASLIGGTTATFASGFGSGRAWNTTTYPAQSTASATAGAQFLVSTAGYSNIKLTLHHRASGTASRWAEIQYTLNGTNWHTLANNNGGLSPDGIFYSFTFDFSAIAAANDNPNFGVRVVSIFSPLAFNQNATVSFGPNEAYMRASPEATYPPTPGSGTGNYGPAGTLRFDNVLISGAEIIGAIPVKLAVIEVNGSVSPSANTPFTVVVQAQDANNLPGNVLTNTTVQLSRASGTGSLGGTLTGTIVAGTHTITFTGITYNVAEPGVSITATRTAGMPLSPGTSALFNVLPKADHLEFVNVPSFAQANVSLSPFSVEARRPDNSVDLNFTGSVTLTKNAGPGNVTGTLNITASAGIATFSDIVIDTPGTYTLMAASTGFSNVISPPVQVLGSPVLTTVILPQFIQGINETNNNRVPFAFRVTLTNLIPNATYRYVNQVVVSSDAATTSGAGNVIFVTTAGDFVRTTSTGFVTPGQYGEFISSGAGTFTGWFVTEPTANVRFTPGNHIFMRIRLNNGAGGTVAQTYLTTADSVKVINFGTANDPLQGTGVYGRHFSTGKNFAFLYDNVQGTGRPISGAFIEDDGTTGGTTYAAFYQNLVNGIDGAFGAIIPNQLVNGIRRVEVRDRLSGIVVGTTTVHNGVWPYGSNTVNPTAGLNALIITPWPDFTANMTNIAPGAIVQFTDLTPGTPTAWAWEFEGGTPATSTLQNPAITYNNTGMFDVTMTVTTPFGTEIIQKQNYINVNTLPWPEFIGLPTNVVVGSAVTFTDQSTGNPTSWVWTFEGGMPDNHSGQTPPAILYNTPGSFDVTLTVTNHWGSNTMTKTDYITAGYLPVANFTGNPTSVIEGQPVTFTDQSLHNPTSWEWVFEGGTPSASNQQNPVVFFMTPGSYDITLTATNAFGSNQITKSDYISVLPVGIAENKTRPLSVWPNPSTGIINLSLPQEGMTVRVFNASGQLIYSSVHAGSRSKIDLSTWGQGFYIMEASNSNGTSSGSVKLMIR